MSNYRMSGTYRQVLVQEVFSRDENLIATVVDLQTGSSFSIIAFTPDGNRPLPGEVWLCKRDIGQWRLTVCLAPARSDDRPDRSFADVVARLNDRGIIHWSPDDSQQVPERAHLAYLGECRTFIVGLEPRGWLRCNGQAVSRNRWRDLFNLVGTTYGAGNGTTTFTLPSITSPTIASGTTVAWYICGE